jgi:hypothetical protein
VDNEGEFVLETLTVGYEVKKEGLRDTNPKREEVP